jgi:UDP-3-O-[3-hydroxymyristoyl] N-acetylglucosamine deacetylase
MDFQTTLASPATYVGIGLHSGKEAVITLNAAPPHTGIIFCRTDIDGSPKVAAIADNVTDTMRATTLQNNTAKVFTAEHLLAALYALQIDNCFIEISSAEPPVADGSALPFAQMIEKAGIARQEAAREKHLVITETIIIRDADKFIAIAPYDGFRITFTSINPNPKIGVQFGDYEITPENFIKEIAPARTIGFMHEVEALKAQGMALGGSLENAVVYDGDKVLTPLRFQDELVRHKILDVIGDLSLAGRIKGHVIAVKSSHALNTALAKEITKKFIKNLK